MKKTRKRYDVDFPFVVQWFLNQWVFDRKAYAFYDIAQTTYN